MLITIVRRASCMNACNIKHVWYCKHSCSWLDERTTSARRALVEHTSSTHQAHQAMSTTRRPGLMSLMCAWCVLVVCSSSQLVEPASSCKRGITVLGREFQAAGAEQRKARLAKAVLANGSDSRVVAAERIESARRHVTWCVDCGLGSLSSVYVNLLETGLPSFDTVLLRAADVCVITIWSLVSLSWESASRVACTVSSDIVSLPWTLLTALHTFQA